MEVPEEGNRFFSEYGPDKFYFCSAECKRKFDDHPDQYIWDHARQELGL